MYPVLKDGVSIGTFQYEGPDTTHFYIKNADGEEYEINHRLWDALLQADGTRPLNLPGGGQKILPELKRHGLVQTSRFVKGDDIFNRFILFPISNKLQNDSLLCKAINAALPVVAVLIFAIGIYLTISSGADTGILLLGIIPIGAYVAHEDKKDASRSEKTQFALAGVEVNLLLAGICLLIATHYYPLSLVMVSVANINVVLAGINLLPASGLDGESALSAVCGVNSIGEIAKKWLLNKKRRQKLLRSGFSGYACFCLFGITLISGVLLWLLIGLDIVSVFFNFF